MSNVVSSLNTPALPRFEHEDFLSHLYSTAYLDLQAPCHIMGQNGILQENDKVLKKYDKLHKMHLVGRLIIIITNSVTVFSRCYLLSVNIILLEKGFRRIYPLILIKKRNKENLLFFFLCLPVSQVMHFVVFLIYRVARTGEVPQRAEVSRRPSCPSQNIASTH